MSTAIVKSQSALDRLTRSLEKSSLDDLVRSKTRRSLMLVDVSSSMNGHIADGGTKMAAMRTVVKSLRETHPVPVAMFGGYGVALIDEVPYSGSGGTPLHDGIDYATREGATHLVVVTDGMPDSQTAAFEAARLFGGVIDCFYIGDANHEGAQFCKELARRTGGTVNVTDLGQPKALAGKIVGLLGDGGAL
jgi:Mg-chelatase subunit ChlD